MNYLIPYLITMLGVALDWVSTQIGLGRGFYETHSAYNPFTALFIFVAALGLMEVLLGSFQYKRQYQTVIASMSFLGAANNTLVILGVFGGLIL